KNANTEVVTDIIFLRRLASGERPSGPAWLYTEKYVNEAEEAFQINEYFVNHPKMMLGEMAYTGTMYRKDEPTLEARDENLADALKTAINRLPENVYRDLDQRLNLDPVPFEDILAPDYLK